MRNLPLGAPDVLEETVTLGETVQRVVALTHGTDETRESVDDVLALDCTAVLIHLGDGNLAGAVVLGSDDPARRRALARDVTRGRPLLENVCGRYSSKLTAKKIGLQVDDFATVVLHLCGLLWVLRSDGSGFVAGAGDQDSGISGESRISTNFADLVGAVGWATCTDQIAPLV